MGKERVCDTPKTADVTWMSTYIPHVPTWFLLGGNNALPDIQTIQYSALAQEGGEREKIHPPAILSSVLY